MDAAELAAASRPAGQYAERIVVKDGDQGDFDRGEQTGLCGGAGRLRVVSERRQEHLKQQTISGLELALDPALFVRIHRSYIVNLERVVRIEPYAKDSKVAILTSGVKLPVSRAGYARLNTLLEDKR